jgi:hypothetical protein
VSIGFLSHRQSVGWTVPDQGTAQTTAAPDEMGSHDSGSLAIVSNISIFLGAEFDAELARERSVQSGLPAAQEPYLPLRDAS